MIIVTGEAAKAIYKKMRKLVFVPTEIYDYDIANGAVAIDRKTGDVAITKRKYNAYIACKGKPAEYLLEDEIPLITIEEISDMISTARAVIYK